MRAIALIILLSIIGCSNKSTYDDMVLVDSVAVNASIDTTSVEYLLDKSNNNLHNAEICFKKSDSVTEKIVERKIYEKQLLKQLAKQTNTIVIKDTVYIETSKNFWGKKKTKITQVSDSVSLSHTQVDTLK